MKLRLPAALAITAFLTATAAVAVQPAANAAPANATPIAKTAKTAKVHFATPLAAMRYLATAANRDDVTALHHVTSPASFKALMAMRSEAVDVRAKSCSATGRGDYTCFLQYRYPKTAGAKGNGAWIVIVAPAVNPGWYLYQFVTCGG